MKKLIALAFALTVMGAVHAFADDNAYFKAGPLELNIPLKTTSVTYIFDFGAKENLVGGTTPVITLWNKVEGDLGVVTSVEGAGTPFVGGNILIGNLLDQWITLPSDFSVGFVGGYNFHTNAPIYGPQASLKIW